MSIKPGASQIPSGNSCTGMAGAISAREKMPLIRAPSITTAASRRKLYQEGIKTLDHADRIGIGMIGRQHRQATGLRTAWFGNHHASALAAQITDESRQTCRSLIARIKRKYRKCIGNKR